MGERAQRLTKKLKKNVEAPDFGLKCIVAFKLAKATFLLLVAFGAFAAIHRDVHESAVHCVRWCGLDPTEGKIEHVLSKLTGLTPHRLAEVGAGAIVFACFVLVEAWGLWNRRVWAELLTIVATSLLVPVEVYELCRHPSLGKVAMLLVNVLIVLYLARHHYLFFPGPIGRWLHEHLGAKPVAE
jgi:uncharacterized membrane protein (DUF2068 family)